MRCTQPQGLTTEAQEFLKQNAKAIDPCSHCGRNSGYERITWAASGMDADLPLYIYALADGRTATERVQAIIHSSGPMIWLKLVVSDGGEVFEWDKEQITE